MEETSWKTELHQWKKRLNELPDDMDEVYDFLWELRNFLFDKKIKLEQGLSPDLFLESEDEVE